MAGATRIENLLRRDRQVTLAGLVVLCVLAWAYLIAGAGTGMSVLDAASRVLFPSETGPMDTTSPMHQAMMAGHWPLGYWVLVIAMWWVMMIAMMTPSAAPTILLYARVARDADSRQGDAHGALNRTATFAAGYLLVWLAFSIAATASQRGLEAIGVVSAMTMSSISTETTAALLITAGVYQWTPLKGACLEHCRAPVQFLSRHWRPGSLGAVRLGVLHGAYCVGCCWALMALLFAGGVMNPLWIAGLTVIVLVEKLASSGVVVSRIAGGALIAWGVAVLIV